MISTLSEIIKLRQRREIENYILSVADAENNLSPALFQEAVSMLTDSPEQYQDDYLEQTRIYNEQQREVVKGLIFDLAPGLKHHSIHCISFRECMSTVIGLDIEGFGRLFHSLREPLRKCFPRCPETLAPGETSPFMETRFRLFLCLYRLKQAATFQQMEVTFGWASSTLQESFDVVLRILVHHLHHYHEGFLDFKGPRWQGTQIMRWWVKHETDGTNDQYAEKVAYQNAESKRHGHADTIDGRTFSGSIGAVDGTYSVQPAIGTATLRAHDSDPLLDVMWSEYKRCHAYKLLIVNSHGLDGEPKYLLWVATACGSASDSAVYSTFSAAFKAKLDAAAVLLGDHAFHGALNVIAPYTAAQVRAAIGQNLAAFNKNHSSDRMTSEHGVRSLKLWGVARGREDSFIFQNEENFNLAIKAVWALHNYKADGCPLF